MARPILCLEGALQVERNQQAIGCLSAEGEWLPLPSPRLRAFHARKPNSPSPRFDPGRTSRFPGMNDLTASLRTDAPAASDAMRRPIRRPALHVWLILIALSVMTPLLILEQGRRRSDAAALTPVFSHAEGYYERDVELKIRVSHPEAGILFTTDGQVPTLANGTRYTGPIRLRASSPGVTVIRARALLPTGELGPVASRSYFVGLETELPILSLIIEPSDFWGSERGIYANPEERGKPWERPVEVVYLEAADGGRTRQIGFHVPAGLRIHGGTTRANAEKKSLRLYFRDEYGFNRLDYPLFTTDGRSDSDGVDARLSSFKRLVVHSGGQDRSARNWTLMRIPVMNDLAERTDSYTTVSRPVLVTLNGELQGIFYLRTYIDDWFFADQFGIEAVDFLDEPFVSYHAGLPLASMETLPPLSDLTAEQQAGVIWERTLRFMQTADMTQPENYAFLQTQIDMDNFIDYNILQIYAANNDWLHHNVKQFRPREQGGRWNWILWDVDWSLGKAWQSSYEFNMIDWLYTCERKNFERGSLPLRKLLENPDFRAQFLSRTNDLLNTVLRPEHVVAAIDRRANEIRADIHYEVARWPRAGNWEEHVEYLREFAERRPDALRQNMVDGFGLAGTDALTINPPATGRGRVAVNGTLVPESWHGIYFKGTTVNVTAAPEPGFRFAGWEPAALPQEAELTVTVNRSQTLTPRFVPADSDSFRPGDLVITDVQVEDVDVDGDWFQLLVTRRGGLDLRNWRITDNDTITATDEGSLIFADHEALAHVPRGTSILIVATQTAANDARFPHDQLPAWRGGRMVLYVGNEHLDARTDPWFNLGEPDNLVVLAPGPTAAFHDDQGIAFATTGDSSRADVTPASFGVLSDGVTTGMPTVSP
jgi:hypothetical protein